MKNLYFKVADAFYRVVFDNDDVNYKAMMPSHGRFFKGVDAPEEDLMFTLFVGDGRVPDNVEGLELVGEFDSGDCVFGVYRRTEGGYIIRMVDNKGVLCGVMRTNADISENEVSLCGNEVQKRYGLQNCIMVCFAFSGAYHGILLIHASAPMVNGYAYAFQGVSGTGKSTHSQLWLKHIEGAELLNDDNPAIRFMDGKTYIYGTPWSGKTPCYKPLRLPLGAFLKLHQHPENIIRKLTPIESYASILTSSSTMIWDRGSYEGICNTISNICGVTPCYDLKCRPDEEACMLSSKTIRVK